MVFSLAPKAIRKLLFPVKRMMVSKRDTMICVVKQLPRVRSADSLSPFPIKIEALGAPPFPTKGRESGNNHDEGHAHAYTSQCQCSVFRDMSNIDTVHNIVQHVDDLGCNCGQGEL